MQFLVCTLYAPLAAFGEIAPSERRLGWTRPGRSAMLGLVAAALGIERADEAGQAALDHGLGLAIETRAAGRPLFDYHTAQVPGTRRGRRFATRRDELAADSLNTVLSLREWRTDALHLLALWRRAETAPDLPAIQAALEMPHYVLYLGRKAGPLGLPLAPALVEAETIVAAFDAWPRHEPEREIVAALPPMAAREIAIDAADRAHLGLAPDHLVRLVRRRDAAVHRLRRQFRDRDELLAVVPKERPR